MYPYPDNNNFIRGYTLGPMCYKVHPWMTPIDSANSIIDNNIANNLPQCKGSWGFRGV